MFNFAAPETTVSPEMQDVPAANEGEETELNVEITPLPFKGLGN